MGLAALRPWMPEGPRPEPARLDPITLLPNRRQYSADAMLWGAGKASLVLVTLSDAHTFSEILRVFGHARSEAFLRAGAERLRDILGPGTAVYHVNQLSFVFRLPGRTEPDAPQMVDRIVAGFREPIHCDDVPIDTRIGIGLKGLGTPAAIPARTCGRRSPPPRTAGPPQGLGLVRPAARRGAPPRLPPALRPEVGARHRGPAGAALPAEGRPRVRSCDSAEALLRWTHPEFGPVSPGEFVALAETTALVTPMTRWVIDSATRQAAVWAAEGLDIPVAINVSPKNLEEPDFVEYLLFCCTMRHIDRARVELKVTEGIQAARGGLILDRLAALRKLGFSIAIDDFGSGYSNMSYLTRLWRTP